MSGKEGIICLETGFSEESGFLMDHGGKVLFIKET